MQEPCSTLRGVGHFGHRFPAFWLSAKRSVLLSFYLHRFVMSNSAMETVETFQDASEVQYTPENRTWSEEMEQQAVEVENANDDEPQRNSLIAPPGDDGVPDAIEKMINNGIKFTRSTGPWKIEQEGVRVRKSLSVYFTLDTHVPVQQIIIPLDQRGIDYDDIISIQRRLAINTFVVSFRTADAKAHILSAWDINVAGRFCCGL